MTTYHEDVSQGHSNDTDLREVIEQVKQGCPREGQDITCLTATVVKHLLHLLQNVTNSFILLQLQL